MKKLIILSLVFVLLMLVLNGCTPAGAELGLVGKWSCDMKTYGSNVSVTATMEFKNDDTGSLVYSDGVHSMTYTFKVTKADSIAKTIDIEYSFQGNTMSNSYTYVLTYNELKLTPKTSTFAWIDGTTSEKTFKKQ